MEIKKLQDANNKLKQELEKNEKAGEKILAEMGAVDEGKKTNKDRLDNLKANFNNLKREI